MKNTNKKEYQEEVDRFQKEVDAMKSSREDKIIGWIWAIFLIICLLFATAVATVRSNYISDLESENNRLAIENAEYSEAWSYLEDYLDLLNDIYEEKIDNAVLEERIKWLEAYAELVLEGNQVEGNQITIYNFDYANQMFDDFKILFEAVEEYVESHDFVDNAFFEQFEAQYPNVYARIEQYDDLF